MMMSTRNDLARKRLTPDSRIVELEHDLDAAQHLLHEIVIAAFRREPASEAEYRAYHRKLYGEAIAAMFDCLLQPYCKPSLRCSGPAAKLHPRRFSLCYFLGSKITPREARHEP